MRLERLEIEAWGGLRDVALELGDAPLAVLWGPNESGKTTLLQALQTALFGFRPARLDGHPLAPWSGGELALVLHGRMADGRPVRVQRRLGRSARGELDLAGDRFDLRNGPLPWAQLMDRRAWLDGLRPAELDSAQLAGDPVGLAARPGDPTRSALDAARAVETRAATLWRPDRRGRPRARELADALRSTRHARREALAEERRQSEQAARLHGLEARLAEVDAEHDDLVERLARSARDGRRLALLRERDGLRARAADLLGDRALPRDVDERLESGRRALAEGKARVRDAQRELTRLEPLCSVTPDATRLVDQAATLAELSEQAAVCTADERRLAASDEQLATWRERRDRLIAQVLHGPLDAPARRALHDLPGEALREAVRALSQAREERERARRSGQAALDDLPEPDGESPPGGRRRDGLERLLLEERLARAAPSESALTGAAALGLALAAVPLAVELPGGVAVAVAAAGFALTLLTTGRLLGGSRRQARIQVLREALGLGDGDAGASLQALADREAEQRLAASLADERRDAEARLAAAHAEHERHAAHVQTLLGPLPLAPDLEPDLEWCHGLERLADAVRRLDERDERARALRARTEDLAVRVAALELPEADDPFEALSRARARLEELRPQVERARALRAELVAARDEQLAARQAQRQAARQLQQLQDRVALLDPSGDVDAGLAVARRALHLLERAESLQRELDADPRATDLEQLEAWHADDALRLPDSPGHERWERRVRELHDLRQELDGERARLRARQDLQPHGETVADLDGRLAALEAERRDVLDEHDRLRVLAAVLREGEQRWRAGVLGPMLARASHWAARLTDGRWRVLELQDDGDGTRLLVRAREGGEAQPVSPPLSRGTCDQLRLALRLAVLESCEEDEPLPLVLDEAFGAWDDRRASLGAELLARVAERRQVLVLTCRRGLAERLAAETEAPLISLGDHP